MKTKYTLLFLFSMFTSLISFSQGVQEKIEAQAKDPKTKENAAKADVYISKNKSIVGDGTFAIQRSEAKSKTAVSIKNKKKRCKKN